MAKPAAEPVEKNILNLFLAAKEVLLYNWKSVNGLSRSKCRDQSLCTYCRLEKVCAVGIGSVVTAEEVITV